MQGGRAAAASPNCHGTLAGAPRCTARRLPGRSADLPSQAQRSPQTAPPHALPGPPTKQTTNRRRRQTDQRHNRQPPP
eukprot:2316848-Pyramimonas_sp.AAC.1